MIIFKKNTKSHSRFFSIDFLRGLTIFLMIVVNTPGSWNFVYSPLKHSIWHGCTLADLVFPSFIFLIGLSMSISVLKSDNKLFFKKIFKRSILIFLIGFLLNWFPFFNSDIENVRVLGVLQRIAFSYFIASILILFLNKTKLILLSSFFLLIVHWVILFVFGASEPYSLSGNISQNIDGFFFSKSQIYQGFGVPFDPEGILGALSSSAQLLFGFIIGRYLFIEQQAQKNKLVFLFFLSILMILISLSLNIYYPINKPLWTGTYVFFSSSIILIFLIFSVFIIDLKQKKQYFFFFFVFGRNPLFNYVLSIFFLKINLFLIKVEGESLNNWLYSSFFSPYFEPYFASLLFSISFALFVWVFSFILFLNKKIIKI